MRKYRISGMIVLDFEDMIESRRPPFEFLSNVRNKYQFLNMAKKHKQKLLLIENSFIIDTVII